MKDKLNEKVSGRREFLAMGLSAAGLGKVALAVLANRKFYSAFTPGSIGVRVNQTQAIELAARHGYESVQPFLSDLSKDGIQPHLEAL